MNIRAAPEVAAAGECGPDTPQPAKTRGALAQYASAIGNRTAASAYGGTGAPRFRAPKAVLARYGSGEHAQLGGTGKQTINGVELDEGTMIAMGDFYASYEDMEKAPKQELEKLKELIDKERKGRLGQPGGSFASTGDWQAATGGRYLELAKANDAHFAPGKGGKEAGPNHRASWEQYHRKALDEAHKAATGDKKVPQRAIGLNAFGNHFLTDAFAAGHLFNKREILDKAKKRWADTKTTGVLFKENKLTKSVARKLLADPVAGPKLRMEEIKFLSWEKVDEQRLSELVFQIALKKPDTFFNAAALLIHNRLNDALKDPKDGGDPAFAVEVKNANTSWKLSGDDSLKSSPQSKEESRKAVALSNKNLEDAASSPTPPVHKAAFERVWALVPKPTSAGQDTIDKAIKHALDFDSDEVIDAFTAVALNNVDTMIAELEKAGYMRAKSGGAAPAPTPSKPAPVPAPMPGALPNVPPHLKTPPPMPSGVP